MATEARQAGLTADERSDIRSTVLDTRELIEDDLYRQLERYGVYEDERVDLEQLGHLDAYDKQVRRTIDAALDRELEATDGDYQRSVENYVREATKTYLNRLVALKAIEVRGLVTETLVERPEYGNRSEMLRTVDEVAGELTDQQDGGQTAALELAYTELTDEIGVIFEESEHTAIDLDFAVREEVIEQLNEIDESVWESDEAMGWVYQYFGEREREEIDDRIDEENYKVQDTDVATKTQLFTPRYIVEWMVDNSLGRLWMEMRGEDTNIDDEDNCFYLAPLEESLIDRDAKNVRDIKILDPACGSGHMLFYAFDVLYEMYLEQGDVAEKYIPREILKHNLYGIDIDPGAAQLAALSLYVKAKSEESDVEIEQINIVSADAVLVNGEKKEEVLARADTDLEKRVLEQVWRSFENIREWGSLVRIEERIEEMIDEELEEIRATGQTQFTEDGLAKQSSVVSYSGDEESWEHVKERLLDQVSELAEGALERDDPIEEMFVEEVEKSVQLLDLFISDYDIVVSNPPYLSSAKIEDTLKKYVKDNYRGSRDLYTAFIERCTELASDDNYVTMVTPESFMFLYSYRGLRKELVSDVQIIEGAHLSGYSFPPNDRPFTIPFVLRNQDSDDFASSRFYRMTHEQKKYSNFEYKKQGLKKITLRNRNNESHQDVYVVDQNTFAEIDRTPFAYWFGPRILDLFEKFEPLDEYSDIIGGVSTGDNDHHLRKYWEVPDHLIGEDYEWFVKSGENKDYYDKLDTTVRWENEGENIAEYGDKNNKNYQGLSNINMHSGEGVVFRNFGSTFTGKLRPSDSIFDKSVYQISLNIDVSNRCLLGYLNSNLYRSIIQGINPSLNFNPSDAGAVPFKLSFDNSNEIESLVEKCIQSRKQQFETYESAREFDGSCFPDLSQIGDLVYEFLYKEEKYEANIAVLHSKLDEYIYKEYDVPERKRDDLNNTLSSNYIQFPYITSENNVDPLSSTSFASDIPSRTIDMDEYDELVESISSNSNKGIAELSEYLEISPYSVVALRYEHDLYTDDEREKIAARLLSYYLGCIMGRWNLDGCTSESDGILVFDDQFDTYVERRIRECIKLTFDDPYESETRIEEMLGRDPIVWLRNRFFRYHHCKEYRRRGQRIPIYWHLESDEGAFSCFVYYHMMDSDTLPKLRGQYIDKKLDTLQNRLEAIESELETADGGHARDLRSEKEEIQANIDDITEFRNRVDALIEEGFEPDFGAGIWDNIQKVDEHDLLAVPLDKL